MNKHNRVLKDALKILGISEISEIQLREYLGRKGHSLHEISDTISFLKKNSLISDERLAELTVEKYIRKKKGIDYIYQVLSRKGVSDHIISKTLARIYPESLEYKNAKELLSLKKPLKKALLVLAGAGFSRRTIEK